MAWNLARFRKQIKYVSLNQYFELEFGGLDALGIDVGKRGEVINDTFTALARSTELPSKTLETENVAYYGADFKINSKATYNDWSVTFMETSDNMRNFFLRWTDLAYNTQALQNNPHASYKVNGIQVFKIDNLSKDSVLRTGVRFFGLWPTNVGSVSFDQAGGSLLTYDVTFTYDFFEPILRDVQK
jgi:hypothetical protein